MTGCSKNETTKPSNKNKLKITTTFFPMYEFAKEITGKYAHVEMIMPSNIEPHDFEPSAKNIAQINDSKLFIYNSNSLENWVPAIKKANSQSSNTKYVEAAKGIKLLKEDNHEDPHVWLDPQLAIIEVQNISDAICKADPKHKDYYQKRTNNYIQKLQNLSNDFSQMANDAKVKTFVVQHQAFDYLAENYHLKQKALTGISDDSEPSAKKLAEIQKYMQDNNLHYIFVEQGLSPKIAKTIQTETNAKLLTLNTLEQVSPKQQKDGATYISLMEENLQNLQKGLN